MSTFNNQSKLPSGGDRRLSKKSSSLDSSFKRRRLISSTEVVDLTLENSAPGQSKKAQSFENVSLVRKSGKSLSFVGNDLNTRMQKLASKKGSFNAPSSSDATNCDPNSLAASRDPLIDVGNTRIDTWTKRFEPQSSSELALHPKKIDDVRRAMELMIDEDTANHNRVLVLTGPSGAGKSTTVKVLAKELVKDHRRQKSKLRSNSWKRPMAQMFQSSNEMTLMETNKNDDYILEWDNNFGDSGLSNISHFSNFLTEARMFRGPNLKFIIVEDLPNVFHYDTRVEFQRAITSWLSMEDAYPPYPPLIIIISEVEGGFDTDSDRRYERQSDGADLNTAFTADAILSKNIMIHRRLSRVKFNPVAKRYLTKGLKRIADSTDDDIKELVRSINMCGKRVNTKSGDKKGARGKSLTTVDEKIAVLAETQDIRSAVSALEFWMKTSYQRIQRNKVSGYTTADPFCDMIDFGRDSKLSYFHSLGRILFGTEKDSKVSNDDSLYPDKLKEDGMLLNLGILENYGRINKGSYSLIEAAKISECLSSADLLFPRNRYSTSSGQHLAIPSIYAAQKTRLLLNDILGTSSKNCGDKYESNSGRGKYIVKQDRLMFPREWKMYRNRSKVQRAAENYLELSFQAGNTQRRIKDALMDFGFYEPKIFYSRQRSSRYTTQRYISGTSIPRLGGSLEEIQINLDSEIDLENARPPECDSETHTHEIGVSDGDDDEFGWICSASLSNSPAQDVTQSMDYNDSDPIESESDNEIELDEGQISSGSGTSVQANKPETMNEAELEALLEDSDFDDSF